MGACGSSPQVKQTRPTGQPQQTGHAERFQTIRDRFESIEEVQEALRGAGLESSEVIVAIDFTKSNEQTGARSFGGQCLHSMQQGSNPYVTVMSIVCKTLAAFDDDHMIPAYGFGDVSSREQAVFSFGPGDTPIHTLDKVLDTYRSLAPRIQLSGPTSFAPAIMKAINIVHKSGGRYHILVIIADGQVQSGACMENTKAAIVEASAYPLSIIMICVGDGPWHDMVKFDDELPARVFDNFQFVNFTELAERATRQGMSASKWEASFALASLMEIPDQYALLLKRGALGRVPARNPPDVRVLEPPF